MQPTRLVLTPLHPEYPIGARAMARPPDELHLRGTLPNGRALAVVGTRRATAPALQFTRRLAERACEAGWSIWSGGATGIDTAAHLGALQAGGKTVVVMGTGFAHTYPKSNRDLFERVLDQGGAWLSPYPEQQRGARWTFLPRNELLASLVDDVVIVQAPARSGARSTVAAARRMGKRIWAVPASPWDRAGAGCLAELEAGARALTSPTQLFGSKHGAKARRVPAGLTELEREIVHALTQGSGGIDQICERSGLPAAQATAGVLTLTLKRVLLESADGSYHLNF